MAPTSRAFVRCSFSAEIVFIFRVYQLTSSLVLFTVVQFTLLRNNESARGAGQKPGASLYTRKRLSVSL